MFRKMLFILTFTFCIYSAFSQTHLSVNLDDPVYDILDYIQIRNYTRRLPTAKPYSLDLILNTLYDALDNPDITRQEKDNIYDHIDRLSPQSKTEYIEGGSAWQNIGIYGETGTYRYEDDISSVPVSVEIGTELSTNLAANINDGSFSQKYMIDVFIKGDLSSYFSYNVNIGGRILLLDYSAYSPYTFSQNWDGYLFLLNDFASFAGATEELVAGEQMLPELTASFWDNKLIFSYARNRRDWGTGSGNLLLSHTAQPFLGFEMKLNPADFLSLSTVTGVLEYYRENNLKDDAEKLQTAYTGFLGEIFFGDYAYMGITSSAIWAKRFELGYMMPGMVPFLAQSVIGDFDNVLFGISFGLNLPKYATFYYNLLTDEFNPTSDDFFHKDRNMYAYQTGLKVAIPNSPFVTFNFQYTKLEPYMYTHPATKTPWYEEEINTSYINHGESLGYYLPPNSDELKVVAKAIPFWYLNASLSYSLIRHGVTYGSGRVDGSSLKDELDYTNVNAGTKYFLTDGTYEWIHSLGLLTEFDLRSIQDIPVAFKLGYTLSFTHHTEPEVLNKSFKPVNNSEYSNTWANYLTLSIKLW